MNEKKYLKNNEKLMKEWNFDKNNNLEPSDFMSNSNKKVWWKCKEGHEWEAVISSRTSGRNCPYCAGKKRLKGFNDIFTLHPSWKKYWDFQINDANNINPYSLGDKSHIKVNWICSECGKKFIRVLSKTKDNVLCLECANKNNGLKHIITIIKNKGSLLDNYPDIAKEWNYEKNGDLKPENVSANSNKKVWWKCSKGHEWDANIHSRTSNDRNCPVCSNQKILKGYNDLETLCPDIAKEWNYEKNSLKPYEIGAGSGKKYWWLCKQGHEYLMSPINRVYGMGCSTCSSERKISVPEKTVLYYLKKFLQEEIISNYRSDTIKNKELDIFLPNRNIGIEYDGIFFHQNRKRDAEKDLICEKTGIIVLHVAESKEGNQVKDNYIYYDFSKQINLEWAINILLNKLMNNNKNYDIDIKRDRIEIYNLIDYYEKEQSLLNNYPDIAKEWNYEKNGKLKPEFVPYGSEKKVWWKCSKGHEYESVIHSRTAGSGCPICAGQKVLKGYNDLETFYPEIAKEWNYEKNYNLKPDEITFGSNKKVWWKCLTCNNEWQTSVHERTIRKHNCPYCAGQKAIVGKNDLLTINPKLVKEWNYEKNGDLKPENFMPNSHKKIWWICEKNHEWKASIGVRNTGNGCPYCSNSKLLEGYNDLLTKNPKLAKEWNYEKNGDLKPNNFFPNSHRKVWWKCKEGHEYEANILDRNQGGGCPICSGKQIVKGYNDLATYYPELTKYWNYEKNKYLTPQTIGKMSGKKVWWKCPHCKCEWQLRVADMTKKKYKCSNCK